MMKPHYVIYNGSSVYVSDSMEGLTKVVTVLNKLTTTKSISLMEAPEHHQGNFRVRVIPELEGLI